MYKYFLPFLALLGALFGLFIVYWSQKPTHVPPILFPPAVSPYAHSIAGAGIIEASSNNIAIGSPFQEIVTKVFVVEGDKVKAGDPLFQLDIRNFEAQKAAALAQLNVAKATFQDKLKQFSFYQRLKNRTAVSEQSHETARYAQIEAETGIETAQATLLQAKTNIERSTIRAPIDGDILQVNLRVGEIAPIIPPSSNASTWQTAQQGVMILMGATNPLQMRVDIDEEDCWRFEEGSEATAFVRGNSFINFSMKFLRTEPYVIPKSSFTGDTIERVDTRVLQVLYTFERGNLPIYTGQVMDVFIESKPIEFHIKK